MLNSDMAPRHLKIAIMKLYGTETHELLNRGTSPSLMSWKLCARLALCPKATDWQVTVDDRTIENILGCIEDVPVSHSSMVVPLEFLVLLNTPVEFIIGSSTLEVMQACPDYRSSRSR